MGDVEWFRNHTWDEQIEVRFNEKLRRARRKSQYLRIQACYLANSMPEVALALLERYFELGIDFDWAQAFLDQATALLALGRTEEALASLRKALDRERDFPNLKTGAWSTFVRIVSMLKLRNSYSEALQVLADTDSTALLFPVDLFNWHAAHALIFADSGRLSEALEQAREALAATGRDNSGLRYHSKLGLVSDSEQEQLDRLQAILLSEKG